MQRPEVNNNPMHLNDEDDVDDELSEIEMLITYETNDTYDPRIMEHSQLERPESFVQDRVRDLLIRSNALRKARGGNEITTEDVLVAMRISGIVILNGKEPDE